MVPTMLDCMAALSVMFAGRDKKSRSLQIAPIRIQNVSSL